MNIKRRIVLVLGAGASAPYGFPSGPALVRMVLVPSSADRTLLYETGFSESAVAELRKSLAFSGVDSIDRFLEHRPEFADVGKAMIAGMLSRFEASDDLFCPAEERWYSYLFNNFLLHGPFEKWLENSHVSILTFNYDRSIDYWLLHAVRERVRDADLAAHIVKRIRVVHLHGSLGGSPLVDGPQREYGGVRNPMELRQCVEHLQIVSEAHPTTREWKLAHELLSQASHVAFLGFGFLPENVQRLDLPKYCDNRGVIAEPGGGFFDLGAAGIPKRAMMMGTCFGMTEAEIRFRVLPALKIADSRQWSEQCKGTVAQWMRNNVGLLQRSIDS